MTIWENDEKIVDIFLQKSKKERILRTLSTTYPHFVDIFYKLGYPQKKDDKTNFFMQTLKNLTYLLDEKDNYLYNGKRYFPQNLKIRLPYE